MDTRGHVSQRETLFTAVKLHARHPLDRENDVSIYHVYHDVLIVRRVIREVRKYYTLPVEILQLISSILYRDEMKFLAGF